MLITAIRVTVRIGLNRRDVRGVKVAAAVAAGGALRLPTEAERHGEWDVAELVEVIERPDMLFEGGMCWREPGSRRRVSNEERREAEQGGRTLTPGQCGRVRRLFENEGACVDEIILGWTDEVESKPIVGVRVIESMPLSLECSWVGKNTRNKQS